MQIPSQAHKFYWRFICPRWKGFAVLGFSEMLWTLALSLFPWCLKHLVDMLGGDYLPTEQMWWGYPWPFVIFAGVWVIMELCLRIAGHINTTLRPELRADIRQQVFDYVQDHGFGYFINQFAGNLANKISDLANAADQLIDIVLYNYLPTSALLVYTLALMWQSSHWFSWVTLGWVVIHALFSVWFVPKSHELFTVHAETQSQLSGRIVDSLSNFMNVMLFARGDYEEAHLADIQAMEVAQGKRALAHLQMMRIFLGINIAVYIIGSLAMLIRGWHQGWVTLGDFTLVGMLSMNIVGHVYFVTMGTTQFIAQVSKVRAALDVLALQHEMVDAPNAKPLVVSSGEIVFQDVSFEHGNRSQVLFDQLNVTIAPGEKVGLVGLSGAGKSSFVNLLLRLFDVDAGQILIDGQTISQVTRESLRQQIAMIPQDPSLFHRTLSENIRYGNLQASQAEIEAAAKAAHCHDFIMQLDEGYDTVVGERGVKLSGGQRQRIAIARAFMKNAPILVLDEATSSLDSVTEKIIHNSLVSLMAGRTTVVIAHRLSTLASMDRILVFENGQIAESGSMDELRAKNGVFTILWQQQIRH